MAKEIKTNIVLGGKVAASLQKAFKITEQQQQQLDKAYERTKTIGVKAFKAVAATAATIGAAVIASAEATRDFRKDLAKMYNNAEMAGMSQKQAWSGLEDLYAMSGEFDSANEAMSNLIATGYKGKDLTKVIEAINGATVKWQDTVTQESLADAINETVMSGKSMGQFDEILSRSGVNIETFNDGLLNCNGLAERQQYVLDWLAKSGLTEVNSAYQEQNKGLVDAYKSELKYQQAMAELGKVAEPIAALFKGGMAKAISYFAEKLKNVNIESVSTALQRAGELGKKAFDLIWNALSKIDWEKLINAGVSVLEIFTAIFGFVVDNWSAISPIIYGIVGAMIAYKAIMVITNTITAISNGLKIANAAASILMATGSLKQAAAAAVATAAQSGLNLAFLACPITWIVLGIAAIVAIIAVLAKKAGGFKELWNKVWDGVKTAFGVVKDFIVDGLQAVVNFIQPVIDWVDKLLSRLGKVGEGIKKAAKYTPAGLVYSGIKKIAGNALGGTYSSPLLTWVAEGGDTETIVPHNSSPRSQALAATAAAATGLSVGENGGGNTFIFNPQITAYGANGGEIRSILEDERNKFIAQMEEWAQGQRRVAF